MAIEEIERYNVLADEIRQLRTELKWQSDQLTALRADADKGRAALEFVKGFVRGFADSTGAAFDKLARQLDQFQHPSENFTEWWLHVGHTYMPKYDQPPEHASIAETAWNAALRSVAKRTVTHKRNLHLRPVSRKKRKR